METKPGYMTTEFWTMVFTLIVNFVNVVGIWNWASNWHSGILMTIIGAAYAVARGIAKANVKPTPAP